MAQHPNIRALTERWQVVTFEAPTGQARTTICGCAETDIMSHITIVQGHPDPAGGHFCHAPADAYACAAKPGLIGSRGWADAAHSSLRTGAGSRRVRSRSRRPNSTPSGRLSAWR
jgi:hypothetical protein